MSNPYMFALSDPIGFMPVLDGYEPLEQLKLSRPQPPVTISPVYFSSSRPSDGLQFPTDQAVNQLLTDTEDALEEETRKVVDQQFKTFGRPEWASDYKHGERKMI